MAYKHSFEKFNKDHMARSIGASLPISTKQSIEICSKLRKKTTSVAKKILNDVLAMKNPIPFTRFTNGLGHKKGMGAGRYPLKAAKEFLALVSNVEANAQFKGLNTSELLIIHIAAQNAGNTFRYGRHRRRKMKRTHVEIVVEETKKAKPAEKKAPAAKAPTVKKEAKPAVNPKPVEKKEEKPVEKPVKKEAPKVESKPAAKPVTKPTEKAQAPKKPQPEAKEEKKND